MKQPSFIRDPKFRALFRKGIRVASEAADLVVSVASKPGPVGLLSIGVKVANSVMQMTEGGGPRTGPFFGWSEVGLGMLHWHMWRRAKASNILARIDGDDRKENDEKIYIATLNGIEMGWAEYGPDSIEGPFVRSKGDTEKAADALCEFLWLHSASMKMVCHRFHGITFESDDTSEVLESGLGAEIWADQRRFIESGYPRALLFYGEPGTGKSNIARYVAKLAGARRLRLRARDIEDTRSFGNMIERLRPGAVVIDDLCRAADPRATLDQFDEVRASTRLLLVTANRLTNLDPAVLRRFDDAYHVERLDDGVLAHMLDGIEEPAATQLRGMPIVYVAKYREFLSVLGRERADEYLAKLVSRRAMVQRMSGKDDVL